MSPLRFLGFGLFITVMWSLISAYIYRRLTGAHTLSPRARTAARALAVFVALIVPSSFFTRLLPDLPGRSVIAYLGFATMGCVAILGTFLIARDVLLWLSTRWRSLRSDEPANPARRAFLIRSSNAGIAAASAGVAAAGLHGGRAEPIIERVEVPIEGLHPDLEGLRIAQVSDIHVGATATAAETQRIAAIVNSTEPDLIAVTGDLVDGTVSALAADLAPLFEMKAPMGVHFCTGNHEYYAGWKPWCDHLSANGWRVHLNAHEVHRRGAASLMVAGIPDRFAPRHEPSHRCDLETTCGSAPQTDLRVLLAHQPRSLNELPKSHFDLVLSGHTHGGQFFPFTLLIYLFQPLVAGLYRRKDMWVYVNRGTAHWGPPLRLGARQEVTLLTLTRA